MKLQHAVVLYDISVHIVVEHSAYLIRYKGPLGVWSQQSYEASHKKNREIYSRSTSHDGGVANDIAPACMQMILKCGRLLLHSIRNMVLPLKPPPFLPSPRDIWRYFLGRHVVSLTASEQACNDAARSVGIGRVKRRLMQVFPGRITLAQQPAEPSDNDLNFDDLELDSEDEMDILNNQRVVDAVRHDDAVLQQVMDRHYIPAERRVPLFDPNQAPVGDSVFV